MEKKCFYYARVSSKSQNEERQVEAFKSIGADDRDIYIDKDSGKSLNRPFYQVLRNNMLRSGDTLVITELDRLSRNKSDIKNELNYFKESGIRLKIINIPTTMIDFPEGQEWIQDMVNNILLEVLGAIAEEEYKTIKKRQREGIIVAQAKGTKFGRPRAQKPSNWNEVIAKWNTGEITAVKAMELTGTTKSTFYNLLKQ